jgi:hypothetical protein
MRPIALVTVLALAFGCHTTMRTRVSQARAPIEEPGTCDSAMVRPDETCTTREVADDQRTTIAVVAVLAVIVGGALGVGYVDNHCPFC